MKAEHLMLLNLAQGSEKPYRAAHTRAQHDPDPKP